MESYSAFTKQTYAALKVEELEKQIKKLQKELEYNKAFLYLENLEKTAYTNYCPTLAEYYKTPSVKSFPHEDLTTNWVTSRRVKIIKDAISRYKNQANTKKNPTWANEAKKAAAIVDAYSNETNED